MNPVLSNSLVPLGMGMLLGLGGLLLLIELWPVAIAGGALYLIIQGGKFQNTN